MAKPGTPLFLERDGYRRRRMMDAIRLLVILGAGLWMIPLLWPTQGVADGQAVPTSKALLYVFGVWWALIAISAYLARRLGRIPAQTDDTGAL
ncbi:hypothetical protein [uncultured Roseobacter sp.]|uniref:hypothetical protein n=1 Tax=uncultured Roseobacter sp. TaxID=114847 RepID=UPI00262EA5C6|nr:hypothetical protein [uncultured Roseobacter sp.]